MLGVCYYPEHWPAEFWADDARRMAEMGIEYVRVAEFAWSRLEPARGVFDFAWLHDAITILGAAGLKVIMCTPTATPPKWLMDEHPDIAPIDEQGRVRGFGSRRHYSFSAPVWIEETKRICEIIAREFGNRPEVVGWQTDNEYGCHDTVVSWGPHDLQAFQTWLRHRYQSPEQLNEAWGGAFWSQDVGSFAEVALPNLTVTEANPATKLDFWRFSSAQVVAYDRLQTEIIRKHSPGRFVTHNFMGLFHDFDHFACAEHLDLASWDSYPIGFTERFPFPLDEKLRYVETGHPDMASFHHDLYRGVGRGRWWVMEQQPGPVNWAAWNPIPRKGQIRLFTWEALAHGAEVVSYFRWRQAPFAQEQMHAGLNLPNNAGLSQGGREAETVGKELKALGPLPQSGKAPVALVFDYESSWVLRVQPQGKDFDYAELTLRWYEAVRRHGVDVDIVPPGAPLNGYKLVVVPTVMHMSEQALGAFKASGAEMLFGTRTGSKTRNYAIPQNLPPGPLAELIPMRVLEVSSMRPGLTATVSGEASGIAERWRDHAEALEGTEITARFADQTPAILRHGKASYLAFWPEKALLQTIIGQALTRAGVPVHDLPEYIRLRRRGGLTFAFNYGPECWTVPADESAIVLGHKELEPSGVTAWR